jgi:hypothetical protein
MSRFIPKSGLFGVSELSQLNLQNYLLLETELFYAPEEVNKNLLVIFLIIKKWLNTYYSW